MENKDGNNVDRQQSCSKNSTGRRSSEKGFDKPAADDNDSGSSTGSKCSYISKMTNKSNESRRKSHPMFLLNPDMNERNEEVVLKKRPRRNPGKVHKRRPKPRRRYGVRKPQTRKMRLYINDDEASRTSSRYSKLYCARCGHQCLKRRLEYYWRYPRFQKKRNLRRHQRSTKYWRIRYPTRNQKRGNRGTRLWERPQLDSVAIQVGSTCATLSPLCVNANLGTTDKEESTYYEITPQMIHQVMRRLSMWRQDIATEFIFKCLQSHYELNPNVEELWNELNEKLYVASLVGIVVKVSDDLWTLTCAQQRKRQVPHSHVTLFWRVYLDTMRPVTKKPAQLNSRPVDARSDDDSNLKKKSLGNEIL